MPEIERPRDTAAPRGDSTVVRGTRSGKLGGMNTKRTRSTNDPNRGRRRVEPVRRSFVLLCLFVSLLWGGFGLVGSPSPAGDVLPGGAGVNMGDRVSGGCTAGTVAQDPDVEERPWTQRAAGSLRFATFNMALERSAAGVLTAELRSGESAQAKRLAEIIQRVRPDVLLLNEIDRDAAGENLELFHRLYLQVSQNGQPPIEYAYRVFPASNTGEPSGLDLNANGKLGEADDAFGYGRFPGQYAFAIVSRWPIERGEVRTFQKFLWRDLPGAKWPVDPQTQVPYYSDAIGEIFRLSSKNHVIVPIQTPQGLVHFLAAHPTPPVFDGPEDRNGCRNHDEIKLLAALLDPEQSRDFVDDQGRRGGLPAGSRFVVAGDLNADPMDGDSTDRPMEQLLQHPLIQAQPIPSSAGGAVASQVQGRANLQHRGDPAQDTADFNDQSVGNLRVDYVLPSKPFRVTAAGVFWPHPSLPESELVTASDHRLVWIDLQD